MDHFLFHRTWLGIHLLQKSVQMLGNIDEFYHLCLLLIIIPVRGKAFACAGKLWVEVNSPELKQESPPYTSPKRKNEESQTNKHKYYNINRR